MQKLEPRTTGLKPTNMGHVDTGPGNSSEFCFTQSPINAS